MYEVARHHADVVGRTLGEAAKRDFENEAEGALFRWFHELVNVLHASEIVSKDWLGFACASSVHENANREHLWVASFARMLTNERCDVTIAAEEPEVYIEMRDLGYLDEIAILPIRQRE